MWHAKIKQAYTIGTPDWIDNVEQVKIQLLYPESPWTNGAVTGMLGNIQAESGLNPWRWQNDKYDPSLKMGYGLFGYTPASKYIGNAIAETYAGYGPNLSTETITSDAIPQDGGAQIQYMDDGHVGWRNDAWRPYWDNVTYADLYAKRQQFLSRWSDGNNITFAQYKLVDDVEAATFFFLACFEGPAVPNYDTRLNLARLIEPYVGQTGGRFPVWLLYKFNRRCYNGFWIS